MPPAIKPGSHRRHKTSSADESAQIALLIGCGICLTGCESYHALRLNAGTVHDALQPPDAAALRIRADELRHPYLPPVEFDESNGLSPDEAAILAVLLSPSLRAERDRRC